MKLLVGFWKIIYHCYQRKLHLHNASYSDTGYAFCVEGVSKLIPQWFVFTHNDLQLAHLSSQIGKQTLELVSMVDWQRNASGVEYRNILT